MFSGISWKIIMIQTVLMLLLVGTGYWYWSWSQNRIQSLAAATQQLTTAVQTQDTTIRTLEAHARDQAVRMHELQTDLATADRGRRELEARLRRANLQLMARTDAADLERRINQATQQVFGDLERITTPGATRTPPASTSTTPSARQPPPRPPVRNSP
jgi:Tfp pilus assembly protein PilO